MKRGREGGRKECANASLGTRIFVLTVSVMGTEFSPFFLFQFKFLNSNWDWKPQSKNTRDVFNCSTRHSHMTHFTIESTNTCTHTHTHTHTHAPHMNGHTHTHHICTHTQRDCTGHAHVCMWSCATISIHYGMYIFLADQPKLLG